MEIIQRYDTILNYLINPNFFEIHQDLEKIYYTSSPWFLKGNDVCVLKHNVFYYVTDKKKADHFIKYESETQLHCIINNDEIEEAAEEICSIKTEIHLATERFLKQNTMDFFNILEFPEAMGTSEYIIKQEEKNIKRIKGILLLSEMSEEERELYKIYNKKD